MNNNKIILDLCGGTGAWSKPYRDAGYDVRLITLPDIDITDYIIRRDMLELPGYSNIWFEMHVPIKNVYGVLAAPPCTEFSIAKGSLPRDLQGAMNIVEACLKIVWACRTKGNLKFWALENPRGLLRQFLGTPHYTFEQWMFGGNKCKATDIWGYFKEPKSTVKEKPQLLMDGYERKHAADLTKPECPAEYKEYISNFKGDAKRGALRAITPKGFAQAFYKANK